MGKYGRRKYLINKSLQLRYMAMVGGLMLVISVSTGWVIYSTTWSFLFGRLEGMLEFDKLIIDLTKCVLIRTCSVILVIVSLAVLITMFVVHRVAGPLFRVKRIMQDISNGITPGRVKFRTRDEFEDVADAIDAAVRKIDEMSQENRKISQEISSGLERAKESLRSGEPNVSEARQQLERLIRSSQALQTFRKQQ